MKQIHQKHFQSICSTDHNQIFAGVHDISLLVEQRQLMIASTTEDPEHTCVAWLTVEASTTDAPVPSRKGLALKGMLLAKVSYREGPHQRLAHTPCLPGCACGR